MRTICTLLMLSIFSQTFAQSTRLYKGTINNTFKITLYLQGLDEGTHADPIIGSYKYDSMKDYILLNGYRNNDGNISLVEMSSANFTGTFLGTIDKQRIVGKWVSADQKKTYVFDLKEIALSREQLNNFQKAIKDKADEFRNY
ncbi:hypothetical protein SAMN05443633_105138 [Chryseobacterium arachidis]|uniref:Uncharacterized protein n=1 Tax=Chryseobacterium arachidis TaxID=1416778 RepID=A0A1M5D350_9FLAO|nr:hypothetical protein [Chryseobacterium arachidis]SHF61483.1 hypothetical protein SAMN05443633_105138 [Chryseobacterium arachidis]